MLTFLLTILHVFVLVLADVLKLYTSNMSFVAQKPLIIKGRLSTTSRFDVKLQPIQGKQGAVIYNCTACKEFSFWLLVYVNYFTFILSY